MPRPDAAVLKRARPDVATTKAIMTALDTVMDPELDESVAAMGFIESVTVTGREAEIVFRLPTFWCSANFAYLMATDMCMAVEQLPDIDTARIRLVDHFASGKINRGVAAGRGFQEVFSDEAHANLDAIRRTFRERAFLGRQEKLLRSLVARQGVAPALATTMADLAALTMDGDAQLRTGALRYLALRRHEPGAHDLAAPAFVALDGAPVTPAGYQVHLRTVRSVKGAAEANAEMCRIYLEARISHPAPGCEPENRKDEEDE
jgi:metal-sulfur cluster biosynthetic enzyme